MIISLSGTKRAGKDTIADILISRYGFTKVSLATSLRDLCSEVFQLSQNEFLDDDKKEKLFNEPVLVSEEYIGLMLSVIENKWNMPVSEESKTKLVSKVGVEMKHPRHLLQVVGTDLIRDCIDSDLLLKVAANKIETLDNVVVPDVRFTNERKWMKEQNALMCLVVRPNFNKSTDTHISENDLGSPDEYKIVFNNDETLQRFQIEVDSFFNQYLTTSKY